MSFNVAKTCISREAGSDLSAAQYHFVSVSADGQVDLTGDGAVALGVLQNKPSAAGRAASIQTAGVTKVVTGSGGATRGAPAAADAAGEAVDAATGDIIMGEFLETGAAGAIVAVALQPRGAFA